jgi:hypothetical protein
LAKRQLVRLLNEGQGTFLDEAREVLRAGVSAASWISVDDTGSRHQHRNGACTQLGNEHFATFATFATFAKTASKSRLNFLEVLRAGYHDYVINAEALAYMRQRALAGPVIASLAEHPERHFADEAAWLRHLDRLGITALTVMPDPVRIATEGALWGSIKAHGLLPDTVISPTMPASLRSTGTRYAGCMPSGWCTSLARSPIGSTLPSSSCAP